MERESLLSRSLSIIVEIGKHSINLDPIASQMNDILDYVQNQLENIVETLKEQTRY